MKADRGADEQSEKSFMYFPTFRDTYRAAGGAYVIMLLMPREVPRRLTLIGSYMGTSNLEAKPVPVVCRNDATRWILTTTKCAELRAFGLHQLGSKFSNG